MFLADHLSRAAQLEVAMPEESFLVFSLELESLNPIQALKVTPERLEQLQRCTGQDEALQTLKITVLTGWPVQKDEVPVNIREYWSYREEIKVHKRILFKNKRVVITRVMRPEVKSRIHFSHLGVEACLRKARDTVFWPNTNAEVPDLIKQCSICNEFQAKNRKQSIQSHQIQDRPWSKSVQTSLQRVHCCW